jgi:Skp family chaperone for outer membrane proteins
MSVVSADGTTAGGDHPTESKSQRADRLAGHERDLEQKEAALADDNEALAREGSAAHREIHRRAAEFHRRAEEFHRLAAELQQDHADQHRAEPA